MNIDKINRIRIVGCSGSGKSTLSRFIAEHLNIPCHHMDTLFWKSGWLPSSQEELRSKLKPIIEKDEWILDDTFDSSFDLRLPKTDLLIIINLPRMLCLYRAITRVFKYSKKKRRPDIAEGCDESFDFKFYKYIWNYNKNIMPLVLNAIEKYDLQKKVLHLKTQKDVDKFKNMIKKKALKTAVD